jgi:RNA 2',3'-cyclic 3'-phosphodiesterase
VALEIADRDVLDSLVAFQQELLTSGADLKIVERENLHFTVKFLGEISRSQAEGADSKLKGLAAKSVRVEVRGVGAFPNIRRPNVIWVGVPLSQEESVAQIARASIGLLEGIGETDTRPFKAHATLARARSRRPSEGLTSLLRNSSDRAFGSTVLSELKLKSSVLSPRGPTYTDVGVYPLA